MTCRRSCRPPAWERGRTWWRRRGRRSGRRRPGWPRPSGRWSRRAGRRPPAGLVFDTFFEPGEFVPAGQPVVSLLPPANRLVRFFVSEPVVGTLKVGQPVRVFLDGRAEPVPAVIDFISPQAEYTPPVIYSRETRGKLVYLIEARPRPEAATLLHPGQPVSVRPEERP